MAVKLPELLAPAGDWRSLQAALDAGADSVYFGVGALNMRASAQGFTPEDLPEIVKRCRAANVDPHLTLNTLIYDEELERAGGILDRAAEAGVEMVIVWDPAAITACRERGLDFCVSTQASIANAASANFYADLGARRIVLARECDLEAIKKIRTQTNVEIEAFVHGAMCLAVSGRCMMSHELFDRSANRGECMQPCRRLYEIKEVREGTTLEIGEDYIMSPKDLCTIGFIDQLIEAGIDAFKIEGRKRSPEYVATVVKVYRKAIDAWDKGILDDELKTALRVELERVYNRGFSEGFYLKSPAGEDFAQTHGSVATHQKVFVGRVINYFPKARVAYARLDGESLKVGDTYCIIGETSGVVQGEVESLIVDEVPGIEAPQGSKVTFPCSRRVRERDQLFKIVPASDNPHHQSSRK